MTVAEMTELAGGLAHELRNPLSTMMVNLKLLAENLQDNSANFEDIRRRALLKVDVLRRQAERLQALFDDFLNLATPYNLQRSSCDLNKVVARLVEFFEPMLKSSGVVLQVHLAAGPVLVSADEKLLSQALLNLMVNAQEAMPQGGTLTISTSRKNDYAEIRVADTGIGIAEKDRDRVMRPFFSTKSKGTGLGLSITRRIIQEHSGELNFEANQPQGTILSIRLPLNNPS
jgi:two-component system, NtrC family, sensor histidine kinase HydH